MGDIDKEAKTSNPRMEKPVMTTGNGLLGDRIDFLEVDSRIRSSFCPSFKADEFRKFVVSFTQSKSDAIHSRRFEFLSHLQEIIHFNRNRIHKNLLSEWIVSQRKKRKDV